MSDEPARAPSARVGPLLDLPHVIEDPRFPDAGRVLVVDDDVSAAALLVGILESAGHACGIAGGAEEARSLLATRPFDLVLTDMDMPGESGLDLMTHIGRGHPETPVIMITGYDDSYIARAALEHGAYGFMLKPVRSTELLVTVSNALRRHRLEKAMRDANALLEQVVAARTRELQVAVTDLQAAHHDIRASRAETIKRLARAAESRDAPTGAHVEMMSRYCALIARELGASPERQEDIRLASLMHDIGKIGIPDQILLKPGQLDQNEWRVMQQHTQFGYRILAESSSDLLNDAAIIALTHHERVDGTGYPRGLSADEIPLDGRIAAVADVFDALTSDRPYRKAFDLAEARDMIVTASGSHFDSEVAEVFLDSWDEVTEIRQAALVA